MSDTLSVSTFYQIFRDITRFMHACESVADIAAAVGVKIAPAFKAQGALVQVYRRADQERITHYIYELGEIYREAGPFAGPGQVREFCDQQQVVAIDHPSQDSRFLPGDGGAGNALGMLVMAPLAGQEEWFGFLGLLFAHPREFSSDEQDVLADLAQQCSVAMDKARLLARQRQQFDTLAQQTERLTALGRLASGVAHEINNPLSSILLYSSNMLKKVPAAGFLHEGLEVIVQETKRCKTIIQELQEFSRSKEPKKSMGNLNTVLEKVIRLLENEFRRRSIRLQTRLDPRLPDMLVDIGQMQQVLANLLINASEAVNSQGEITATSRFDEAAQTVSIQVADTGTGIPKEYLNRLFEPFFSTKPKGTGLGLTVSYDFIMNHQGKLQVVSEPGQGSRFTVILPVSTPELDPARTGR